ncbi:MAG TPA: glutamine synthetase adenylyltransferase [Chloroflexi bacterium]|nr:glutamine synthetase adenylyltransferase [Chloroflexota bacterium]
MKTLSPETCQRLLTPSLSEAEILRILSPIGFSDPQTAYRTLQRMSENAEIRAALAQFLPKLLQSLSDAASPDRVLVSVERFARSVPNRLSLYRQLNNNPRAVEILVTLTAGSHFLSEILLRNPEYFKRLVQHRELAQAQTPLDFYTKAQSAIANTVAPEEQLNALRRFQRWQLLRIGASDLLGLLDLITVTAQLSHLADALLRVCLSLAAQQTNTNPQGFVVLGMGKLGGQELNYSSDIDLLFLSHSNAATYEHLGKHLIDTLTQVTAEGFLYRVDMRLRPWGKMGALVTSLEGHVKYLQQHALLWEKQALIKARTIAGEEAVGNTFLRRVQPLIYACAGDVVRADVRAMKTRIEENLAKRGRGWGEVKLGQGSIRDIEFITQYLQLAHGDTHPEIRSPNTLQALSNLAAAEFITPDEYRILNDGYTFLRPVEHWLQMMHFRQTHTLPTNPAAINDLARRLGFQSRKAGEKFLARYQQHTIAIRLVYQAHLEEKLAAPPANANNASDAITEHLARLSPDYAQSFARRDIQRHAFLARQIAPDNLVEVEAIPLEDRRWQVTIVGYDYLGELSMICGLFFVHGFDILEGQVFTYRTGEKVSGWESEQVSKNKSAPTHPLIRPPAHLPTRSPNGRQKIFDVFIVRPVSEDVSMSFWGRYAKDLRELLELLEAGEQHEAQGKLAKRMAVLFEKSEASSVTLYPIDINIDNKSSPRATVLHIDTVDTIGFLYEFSNALALRGLHIARVSIGSSGNRVQDTLYITDARGKKITNPDKQRELRAATVLTKHFTHLLPNAPNPEVALLSFRQFLQKLFSQANWPDQFVSLEQPHALDALARLLGVSEFLWNDFFRMQYLNLLPIVRDTGTLAAAKSKDALRAELQAALQAAPTGKVSRKTLNAFKDREMFRIDMRHIMGKTAKFGQFSAELSDLAEVVVEAAYLLRRNDLTARYGNPRLDDGKPNPMSVCALGKCGGQELGFASDIELIFVYQGCGQTDGKKRIAALEFYEKLVTGVAKAIRAKQEGIFEIDLRLRPYGSAGSLAVSLESFQRYYAPDGPVWAYERQALVKLRPIAGDEDLGQRLLALRDKFIYTGETFDVAAMRSIRERQVRHLVTPGNLNAKHSPGGLVDVEYLVQGLQITHGAQNPALRLSNTRQAMTALHQAGILLDEDYTRLREAHIFLRRLINALRMVHGNAKDLTLPPVDSEEFAFLARRLSYDNNTARLHKDLNHHTGFVQEINHRLLKS